MFIAQRVIHVIEQQRQVFAAFVCHHNLHARLERHRNEAVEALSFGTRQQSGLESSHVPSAKTKEIAQWRTHRRFLRSIPKHFDLESPEHGRAAIADGDPNPTDRSAGALRLSQH